MYEKITKRKKNGECANRARCGGNERRYSYIVITRRARSTAKCQRCSRLKKQEDDPGGKRSSRIRLRWKQHEGKAGGREKSVAGRCWRRGRSRAASRHKRIYDRWLDIWFIGVDENCSSNSVSADTQSPFARSYPNDGKCTLTKRLRIDSRRVFFRVRKTHDELLCLISSAFNSALVKLTGDSLTLNDI